MTAEIAVSLFTLCNAIGVAAYLPQMAAIARDQQNAAAISCCAWSLFAACHLSTAAYGLVVVHDLELAGLFAVKALFCLSIVLLTGLKRQQFRRRSRPA